MSLNYSKTHRMVLLIDLTPLLRRNNPKPYISSLLAASKTLLSFPPLSLSLSSFKLFFSSLSPLLSSSTIAKLPFCPSKYNPDFLSFNHFDETLCSLSDALDLVCAHVGRVSFSGSDPKGSSIAQGSCSIPGPKGVFTSSSIAQVVHDYSWDLCDDDGYKCGDLSVRSNLVVLFSPVCRNLDDLREFVGNDGDLMTNCDAFSYKFKGIFGYVRDAFVSRDIHFSWVDVRFESENDIDRERSELDDECDRIFELFRSGIKGLGWGICSSDSIVFGSALVSFGLIYPMIGVSPMNRDFGNKCEKFSGQLDLEILDVNGKPMECKYCDLELVDIKTLGGSRHNRLTVEGKHGKLGSEFGHQVGGMSELFGSGVAKINVKAVCRHNELVYIEENISDVALVSELSIDTKKNKEEISHKFFANRVLDLLSRETNKFTRKKSPPLWQILLSFLYRRGYWALVSLSNADGSTTTGILKPYTFYSAILCNLNSNVDLNCGTQHGLGALNLGHCSSEAGEKFGAPDSGMDSAGGILVNEGKRKHKKHSVRYKDLSWSSFCKAAFQHCEIELEEAYFANGGDISKKLKFLKCWIKQIAKNSSLFLYNSDKPNVQERLTELHQESDQPLSCLVGVKAVKEPPQAEEPAATFPEASEAFFSNLSQRIQHGIESGVDLVAFAQRVVCSCIYFLSLKLGADTNEESQASVGKSDVSSCGGIAVSEVIKILLTDPKDVAGKHEKDPFSKVPDTKSLAEASEVTVREYELQILFRMEILQSEVAVGIRETKRHKFVKQICSFLELIQCSMEDGFFGAFNLHDYVDRTLSSRYKHSLGTIVHKIYDRMDLLLFDGEDESPNLLLNSEDSSQSWKIGDNDRGSEPNSTDSCTGPQRDYEGSRNDVATACRERKLVKAQERRERALRLSYCTRRAMPELQRVWAPKPSKLSRSKSESFRSSKRKNRRESYDKVCETPMSDAKKCLFPSEFSDGDQECREQVTGTGGSTKRALFQSELFHHDWRP